MNSLRDQAIATLFYGISEVEGSARNHRGHDDRAAQVILSAKPYLVALRDKYDDGAPEPLPALAAQEMRDLSDILRKIGEESRNPRAERDLKQVAGLLDPVLLYPNLFVDSDGRFQFDFAAR